jgi:hypothetical protein
MKLSKHKISLRNEWWDEECKLIMTQKNEARKNYLQAKTRTSRETKRTEANKVCRRNNRDWINNTIKHIEELNDKKETRFFSEKLHPLTDNNQPCQIFVNISMTIHCQNNNIFYKDGNNNFVTYRV